MAITFKAGVGDFAPVYNKMGWLFDSDNKSKEGFRYIFDLYDAGTAAKTRYNPPPRPVDGYGQLDIAPILQCRLSYDASPGITTAIAAKNSYFKYDLKIGEEYLAAFTYTGYAQLTGTGTQFDGKVRLNGLVAHTFVVGDQIEINQTDGGVAVPLLQSLFTVVYVPNSTSVVVNLNYYLVSGLPAMGGTIYYSDRRKIQVPNLYTVSGYTAYNAAIDILDFNAYNFALRKMTTVASNKFLTTMPDGFWIAPTSDIHFNLANMGTIVPYELAIETSDGHIYRKVLGTDITSQMMQIPVGSNNMGAAAIVVGTLPVIKATTTWYRVRVQNSGHQGVSEWRTFNIDRRCDAKDIQLTFMDREGSLASYHFPLQAIFNNDIEKEIYTAENGAFNLASQKYEYEPKRGGRETIFVERKEGMQLTTNWIEWDEADYFGELLASPVVFLRINGVYQMVEVLTVSQPNPHPNKKKLQNRTVTITNANLNPVNA